MCGGQVKLELSFIYQTEMVENPMTKWSKVNFDFGDGLSTHALYLEFTFAPDCGDDDVVRATNMTIMGCFEEGKLTI